MLEELLDINPDELLMSVPASKAVAAKKLPAPVFSSAPSIWLLPFNSIPAALIGTGPNGACSAVSNANKTKSTVLSLFISMSNLSLVVDAVNVTSLMS